MEIKRIIEAIRTKKIRITDHADEEAHADRLSFEAIYFSVSHGEIIEQYPEDKPYPSCLIHGKTFAGESVHTVWAYNEKSDGVVLITVYRPDPQRWIDYKVRKKK